MSDSMVEKDELKKLRAIVQNLPDHVFIVSKDGYCLDLHEGSERSVSIDYSHIIGKHATEVFPEELAKQILKCVNDALSNQSTQFLTYSLKPKEIKLLPSDFSTDEEELWFEGRITPISCERSGQQTAMWLARDITRRRQLEIEIKKLIDFDELTGIYNRRSFLARLSEEYAEFKRYKQKTTVIMIDIDNFKGWNDRLGHIAGDLVIQHVTKTCNSILRQTDYFGRLGGEEFAVMSACTDLEAAYSLGERLRLAIEESSCLADQTEVSVTISIGIACFNPSDTTPTEVLRRADIAMYESKERGKNRVTISRKVVDD